MARSNELADKFEQRVDTPGQSSGDNNFQEFVGQALLDALETPDPSAPKRPFNLTVETEAGVPGERRSRRRRRGRGPLPGVLDEAPDGEPLAKTEQMAQPMPTKKLNKKAKKRLQEQAGAESTEVFGADDAGSDVLPERPIQHVRAESAMQAADVQRIKAAERKQRKQRNKQQRMLHDAVRDASGTRVPSMFEGQPSIQQNGTYLAQHVENLLNNTTAQALPWPISTGTSYNTGFHHQTVGGSPLKSGSQFTTSFMPMYVPPRSIDVLEQSDNEHRFPPMQWPQQAQDFHTSVASQGHPASRSSQNALPRLFARPKKSETPTPASPPAPKKAKKPKGEKPTIKPPKRPYPTIEYLAQSKTPPMRLRQPQPLLIISDLNGTLIFRKVSQTNFQRRRHLEAFLEHIFTTHTVMIWTSARPESASVILQTLLTPAQRAQLIASWARDTLGLTAKQYAGKTQVYKQLERIWAAAALQATAHPGAPSWSQANTLLLDDSFEKAHAQPHNLVNLPELLRAGLADEERAAAPPVLRQVQGYLDEARWWSDVSAFVRARPFAVGQGWERGGGALSPALVGPLALLGDGGVSLALSSPLARVAISSSSPPPPPPPAMNDEQRDAQSQDMPPAPAPAPGTGKRQRKKHARLLKQLLPAQVPPMSSASL